MISWYGQYGNLMCFQALATGLQADIHVMIDSLSSLGMKTNVKVDDLTKITFWLRVRIWCFWGNLDHCAWTPYYTQEALWDSNNGGIKEEK